MEMKVNQLNLSEMVKWLSLIMNGTVVNLFLDFPFLFSCQCNSLSRMNFSMVSLLPNIFYRLMLFFHFSYKYNIF